MKQYITYMPKDLKLLHKLRKHKIPPPPNFGEIASLANLFTELKKLQTQSVQ